MLVASIWSSARRPCIMYWTSTRPTPARWVHVLGALRDLPGDIARVGARHAGWLVQFRTSPASLDHLASDRYLSSQAFVRRYASIFSGARFENLGYAHGLVWAQSPRGWAQGHEGRPE